MNDKRKKLFAASIMLLIGAGLAGCAKSSDDASQKQVLKLSASAPLDTIDISKATGYGQTGNIFESFYRLGKDGKATPGLAKSGKVSKDGLTWTFKLRNAKWSNGDKITADDFVYSWRRSIDPKTESPYAYLFSGVKNADEIAAGKLSTDSASKRLTKIPFRLSLTSRLPISKFCSLIRFLDRKIKSSLKNTAKNMQRVQNIWYIPVPSK